MMNIHRSELSTRRSNAVGYNMHSDIDIEAIIYAGLSPEAAPAEARRLMWADPRIKVGVPRTDRSDNDGRNTQAHIDCFGLYYFWQRAYVTSHLHSIDDRSSARCLAHSNFYIIIMNMWIQTLMTEVTTISTKLYSLLSPKSWSNADWEKSAILELDHDLMLIWVRYKLIAIAYYKGYK